MKKTRILFIAPPISKENSFGKLKDIGNFKIPINLANLAASCRDHGYESRIFDCNMDSDGAKGLLRVIEDFQPNIVGLTAFTVSIKSAAKIAQDIKQRFPALITIVGGVHVTSLPEQTMVENPCFDFGIVGEGDVSIIELLDSLFSNSPSLSEVRGLLYRLEGRIIQNAPRPLLENLDSIPPPAFDLIPNLEEYLPSVHRRSEERSIMMVTSRGCPMRCSFCDRSVLGRKYRNHSVGYVLRLMQSLKQRYGISHFDIEDESMGVNREWLYEFCNEMVKLLPGVTWTCSMRADQIDDEKLEKMQKAGCSNITLGIESGSQKMLDHYNKNTKLETIEHAVSLVNRHAITVSGSFIIGGVGESHETIEETVRFLKKIELDYFYLWFLAPMPGAELTQGIERYGAILSRDWDDYSGQKIVFLPQGLSREELESAYDRLYRVVYFKPRYIWKKIRSLNSLSDFIYTAKLAMNLLFLPWKK